MLIVRPADKMLKRNAIIKFGGPYYVPLFNINIFYNLWNIKYKKYFFNRVKYGYFRAKRTQSTDKIGIFYINIIIFNN